MLYIKREGAFHLLSRGIDGRFLMNHEVHLMWTELSNSTAINELLPGIYREQIWMLPQVEDL